MLFKFFKIKIVLSLLHSPSSLEELKGFEFLLTRVNHMM